MKIKNKEKKLLSLNQQLEASNEQLSAMEQQLRAYNQQLEASNQQLKLTEESISRMNYDLLERIKELNCIYNIVKISKDPEISIAQLCKKIIKLIPAAWQYPQYTCARIQIYNGLFKTNNYKKTKWFQKEDIIINKKKIGFIEAGYLKKMPEFKEGPFFKEERKLLRSIVSEIVSYIKNKNLEEEIKNDASELERSEIKYRNLVENLNEGIWLIDKNAYTVFVNDKMAQMLGYTAAEMKGKHLFDFIDKDNHEMTKKKLQDRQNGVVENHEFEFAKKDGQPLFALLGTSPVLDEKGCYNGALAAITDITENKKLQAQLIQSEKMSVVGQLSAGIAHEFNNILTIILGNVQLSLNENSPDEIRNSLKIMEKTVIRGGNIIRELNLFSRPKPMRLQKDDIAGVINEVLNLQRKQFLLQNIKIVKNISPHSPVLFDRGQMEQVFINLIVNAMHAIQPKGRGTIFISVFEANDKVKVSIKDTGVGIMDEIKKKIFDPFFTTKGAFAKDELGIQGTGLGLSVSYSIIIRHHGTIEVESVKGKGAAFTIFLPVCRSENIEQLSEKNKVKQAADPVNKELKIMIIDDEPEISRLLQMVLLKKKYTNIKIENDTRAVMKRIFDFQPDVIFLDLLMPNLSGDAVLEKIKQLNIKSAVIIMSGKINIDKESYKAKGAAGFLEKPFKEEDVMRVLKQVNISKKI